MIEIKGDLWDFYGDDDEAKKKYVVCITTNGFVKKNGKAVMGRGCAKEASVLLPHFPELLGEGIKKYGNVVLQPFGLDDEYPECRILTFPTKHNWWEKSDLKLIKKSAVALHKRVRGSDFIFILPRPGCGNGELKWKQVKPLLKFLPDNVLVINKP